MANTAYKDAEHIAGKMFTMLDPQKDHALWQLTQSLQAIVRALGEDIERIEKRLDSLDGRTSR